MYNLVSHIIGELSEQEERDGYHIHILNLVKHPQNDCGHKLTLTVSWARFHLASPLPVGKSG